jgi:hypothetical protein
VSDSEIFERCAGEYIVSLCTSWISFNWFSAFHPMINCPTERLNETSWRHVDWYHLTLERLGPMSDSTLTFRIPKHYITNHSPTKWCLALDRPCQRANLSMNITWRENINFTWWICLKIAETATNGDKNIWKMIFKTAKRRHTIITNANILHPVDEILVKITS